MYLKHIEKLILLAIIFLSGNIYSQYSLIGKIIDNSGQPVIGASVFLKESSSGSSSDINGQYSIQNIDKGNYNLTISIVGFKTISESLTIQSNTVKDFTMTEDALLLNEAVVIGYGTARTKDITGSAVLISDKDFNKGSVTTPEQLIMGKIPGVKINSNNGAPGSGSRIRIRGGTSINASNDPLIVIDGVPLDNGGIDGAANPLNLINPNDIASFVVLKDASATAIYGSRGANGVILITTKRGNGADNKLKVQFTTNNSLSTIAKYASPLTAEQYRDVINEFGTANQIDELGDIQSMLGGTVFNNESKDSASSFVAGDLGTCSKVIITKEKTTFVGGNGNTKDKIASLRETVKDMKGHDLARIKSRISRLKGGVATIKVGASSSIEMREKKERLDDALNATKAALEEGIVIGGGKAYLRATVDNTLPSWFIKALVSPSMTLIKNGGFVHKGKVNPVLHHSNPNWGYNALTNEYGDLHEAGLYDPVKVTKNSFLAAMSIASLFYSTDVAVLLEE